jgi:small subunit ribosomal protein S1
VDERSPESSEESTTAEVGVETAPETPVHEAAPAPQNGAKPKPRKRWRRDPAVVRAYRSALPVDGVVEKVIKGGYEVRVGRSRGFCPHSQMDVHRVEQPEDFVGRKESFKITELRRGGEELILSRRAILEEQLREEAKSVRATLIEGSVMQGRVARIADFGAFVDLGAGVIGLVHVTELAHGRVDKPQDIVKVGDRVSARILRLDEERGRISLSIKQAEEDPWVAAGKSLAPGQTVRGIVRRVTDFGAFVEVARGVEALAPAREFPPSAGGFEQAAEIGKEREWIVLSIDPEHRRMSVAPAPEGDWASQPPIEVGQHLRGRVQKLERFGVFVWLGPGRVGLVPTLWTGARSAGEAAKKFVVGTELAVEVIEIAEEGRRIRLGIEGVPRRTPEEKPRRPAAPRDQARPPRSEGAEARERDKGPTDPAPSFGTNLGDALRAAFVKKEGER